MKVEKVENFKICDDKVNVKVTEMGNIIEVQYMSSKNSKANILMIGGGQYIDLKTGEIKDCEKHDDKRLAHQVSLLRTFRNLRNIINSNVEDVKNCQWVTLTYAENMQDKEKLYIDFEKFHKRYKYYLKKMDQLIPEYISVVEPQGRGAWHIHLLYIFEKIAPFVPNDKLRELWTHGFVKITSLKGIDNVGAYLTAYLGDIPVEDMEKVLGIVQDVKSIIDDSEGIGEHIKIDDKGKKYIKGGRLHFYPSKFNIFRTSRGVKRPISEEMTYKKALKKVSGATKTFEKTVVLSDEDNFETIINTTYYNKLR